jgi:chemotaxis protein CheD
MAAHVLKRARWDGTVERDRASAGKQGRLNLGIGEVYIALEPTTVWTVLGSCVAVILFEPRRKVSAICHARLPAPGNAANACASQCASPCSHPCRRGRADLKLNYVTCCVEYMLDELALLQIPKNGLAAALVGGASMVEAADRPRPIGQQNVEVAYKVLGRYGIQIHHEDTGGNYGRTLTYVTDSGTIKVRPPRSPK